MTCMVMNFSGFKPEVQQTILNALFDKEHLFGPQVYESLEKSKKDTEVAKSMGALQLPSDRGSFCRSFYRGGSTDANTSSYKPQN